MTTAPPSGPKAPPFVSVRSASEEEARREVVIDIPLTGRPKIQPSAKFQMPRVAQARGMSEAELRKIIDSQVEYPGGIMRNIADSLDYQFGFKVSKTWIFGFFERAILPAILLWLLLEG